MRPSFVQFSIATLIIQFTYNTQQSFAETFDHLKKRYDCIYERPTFSPPSGCFDLDLHSFNSRIKELNAKATSLRSGYEYAKRDYKKNSEWYKKNKPEELRLLSKPVDPSNEIKSYEGQQNTIRKNYSKSLLRLADDLQVASQGYLAQSASGESRSQAQVALDQLSKKYPYLSVLRFKSDEEKSDLLGELEIQVRTAAALSEIQDCSPDIALSPEKYDLSQAEGMNFYQTSQLLKCHKNLTQIKNPSPEQLMALKRATTEISSLCIPFIALQKPNPDHAMTELENAHSRHSDQQIERILKTAGVTTGVGVAVHYAQKQIASVVAASAACGTLSKLSQRWTALRASGQRAASWLLQKRPLVALRPVINSSTGVALKQTIHSSSKAISSLWKYARPSSMGGPFTALISIAIAPDDLGCRGCDDALGIAYASQRQNAENFYMQALPSSCNLYEKQIRSAQ